MEQGPFITVSIPGDGDGDSTAGRGAEGIDFHGGWAGLVRLEPGCSTTWHHHGDSQAIAFVLSGAIRVESGPRGTDISEAWAGQLMHLPPRIVHRESAVGGGETVLLVVRMGAGETTDVVDPSRSPPDEPCPKGPDTSGRCVARTETAVSALPTTERRPAVLRPGAVADAPPR